ncbi:MAG: (d)CMP kinase [Candidatus Hydrothermarchaeota archaeon]
MVTITIGGYPGSGTSTLARQLSHRRNLRLVSVGELFREIAKNRGMTLEELSKTAEEDHSIDIELDNLQKKIAKEGNVVLEGRLSGWMVNGDIKIWLKAPIEVRAKRVAKRDNLGMKEALEKIKIRELSERKRYKEIYNIDIDDLSIYDIILSTEKWSPEILVKITEICLDNINR